ncbi:hypothetical protein ACOB3G_002353 [Vibrio cholerae]
MENHEYYKTNLRRLIAYYSSDEYLGKKIGHLLHIYTESDLQHHIMQAIAQRDSKVNSLISLYKETQETK